MQKTQSRAVALARQHCEAWSNHDYAKARERLAPDVRVTATSTQEGLPVTNLAGIDDYMKGLVMFGDTVRPGSLAVEAAAGDDRNALLVVTVTTEAPPMGSAILRGARLYLFDEDEKISSEQVIFYLGRE